MFITMIFLAHGDRRRLSIKNNDSLHQSFVNIQRKYSGIQNLAGITHPITLVVRSQTLLVVPFNSRQTLVVSSMLNWPRGGHSLFAPRGIVVVKLYSCIVIL